MFVTLLAVPHDENSSYLRGSADGPPHVRRELFSDAYTNWSESGIKISTDSIRDAGDVAFASAVDDWTTIEERAGEAINGGPVVFLGGDHAITHPILRAVARKHSAITIVHIDAHPDIYDSFQGNKRSHASPFARIMEEKLAVRLIQIGLRTVTDHHRKQFQRFGVEAIEAHDWRDGQPLNIMTPVYVSIDLDGLDPSCAPGVAHREPGGLTTRQVIDIIRSIDQPIVAADVVEFNPACDISNMTALVVAKLIKELAGMMIVNAARLTEA